MSSAAYGRLIFSKEMNGGEARPLHNMKVKLFDDDMITHSDFLAETVTDAEGKFTFKYNPSDAGMLDTPDLKVMVYDLQPHYKPVAGMEGKQLVVKEVAVPSYHPKVHNNVRLGSFDFGDVEVKYWEYAPMGETYTPRLYINEKEGYPLMQEQRSGRKKAMMDMLGKGLTHLADFPVPEVKKAEEACPGASLGDEALVKLMLNGFNPCVPQKAADGRLYVEFKYDGVQLDAEHFAHNSRAYFKLDEKTEELTLDTIELSERIGGYHSGPGAFIGKPKVYSAADGEEVWNKVKRIWRVNYFLFGEANTHLGGTHLNIEQYIVPMMRNVRLSPVFNLLFPHFYGTVEINHGADGLLTGGGLALVPQGSAVTRESVASVVRAGFTGMNWAGFKPRAKLCKGHVFAELQQAFWEVLTRHVDEYVAENEEDIAKHWREIYLWSEELVANGVPFTQQEDNYYDMGEVNKASEEHPKVGEWNVSVSPITMEEELTEGNKVENLENVKQLCKYLLLLTTFKHSWVNDTQYEMGGWPEYATLGLECDILDPKNKNKDPVGPIIKLEHVVTTWGLVNVTWGYILKNEAKDMHPRLVELLEKKAEVFQALGGYDVNNTRCCINI